MNSIFCKKIREKFPQIYADFLANYIYKDTQMVKDLFDDKEINQAFLDVINNVYDGESLGKDFNPTINQLLLNYENLSGDKNLRHYIRLYSYFSKESSRDIVTSNNIYKNSQETKYFSSLSKFCSSIYNSVQTDLIHGNRWWELNSPITLRQQLLNNKLVIHPNKFESLCKKYLGRSVDLEKELHINQKVKKQPLELIAELDRKMAEKGYNIIYCWPEKINNKYSFVKSKQKPEKDIYYIVQYATEKELTR